VLAALEVLRTLADAGYETFAPIEAVNWTNEEGARFSPPMTASGVFAGVFSRDWAVARTDADGIALGAALEAIGAKGPERCGDHPLSAFFELHIEQGPILEAEGLDIGAVTGVQGMRWFEATVTGQEAHTGATPMHLRRNALLGAARLVEKVEAIARAHAPLAVATVGSMRVKPNSPNVVPGEVFLTVDIRHPEPAALDAMEKELEAALGEAGDPLGLTVASTKVWDQPPVAFDPHCIAAVRGAAEAAGYKVRDMVSGAGHDAAYIARVAPTAMIFVPCRGGISHNEAEFSSREQCAAGAQVLLGAVLAYDRRLAERYA
jgi:N-carbamoyl-L-amino-acid hydrolase